jgi:hypothetical protein
MKTSTIFYACFLILGACSLPLQAQTSNFTVDRPGIAETAYIVPAKSIQVETGFEYYHNNTQSRYFIPVTYMRTGLNNMVELRLSSRIIRQSETSSDDTEKSLTGLSAVSIGTKIRLRSQKGFIPDVALLTDIVLPYIGHKDLRPKYFGHNVLLLLQNDISEQVNLNYNIGAIWEGEEVGGVGTYAVCLSYQTTPKVGLFIENYAYLPERKDTEIGYDGGITYLLKPKFQIDLSAGQSFMLGEDNYFVALGFSYRLDKKLQLPTGR